MGWRALSPHRYAVEAVLQIHRTQPAGDVLVFLTGQQEVDTAGTFTYDGGHFHIWLDTCQADTAVSLLNDIWNHICNHICNHIWLDTCQVNTAVSLLNLP